MRKVWWHGCKETNRFWLHIGGGVLALEIGRPTFSIGFGIEDDCERTVHGNFCGFFWHLDCMRIRKLFPLPDGSFHLYWHEGGLWLQLWGNDDRYDRWYLKTHHLDLADLFFGRQVYTSEIVKSHKGVTIPLPEGNYTADLTFTESTWKRSIGRARVRKYTQVSIVGEPPKFPGKGENSWDCGDDGICMMSVEGHSIPAAIGGYVTAVLEMRAKR